MSGTNAKTVVIADYDYGDVAIERTIIERAGLALTAAQCKTEDEVIDVAREADAIISSRWGGRSASTTRPVGPEPGGGKPAIPSTACAAVCSGCCPSGRNYAG
jgi:hypothetical protein